MSSRTLKILAFGYACFFFSGAAALMYEVVWTRALGLIFGNTVFAMTTVLAAFMAGLALGAYLLGRLIDSLERPLKIYGLLELGIALVCLLMPALFAFSEDVYLEMYRRFGLSEFAFSLLRFTIVFVVLMVPTTMMGATFPVLAKLFVDRIESLGHRVGSLYAVNTFGAVAGTAVTGFFLLPSIGMRSTTLIAVAVNLVIALSALSVDRSWRRRPEPAPSPTAGRAPASGRAVATEPSRPLATVLLVAIAVSGAASMAYEVGWTRTTALIIGSSTYAFTTMLTTFLVGLALGSFLYTRLAARRAVGTSVFGLLELGIGLSALALIPLFDALPTFFVWLFKQMALEHQNTLLVQFLISFIVMLLPTVLIGATFPCVAQLYSSSLARVGRDVGRVYSVNTLGTIIGVVVAGFALIPWIGAQKTLLAAAITNLVIGAVILWWPGTEVRWPRFAAAAAGAIAVVVVLLMPNWNVKVLTAGVHWRPYEFIRSEDIHSLENAARHRNVVYYREGINTTVTVDESSEGLTLRVGGKVEASTTGDMFTQLMLGHLPMLLHTGPEDVLVIGLGSGISAGAVAQHQVRRIDVVEIEPAVVEAARLFFKANRGVLDDPRLRLTVGDARNALLVSDQKYDVITSEPSNPWLAGVANLFSREFYLQCRERLAQGGIMAQWLQGYNLYPDDFRMVVKTFQQVFPQASLWSTLSNDYLLIGGADPVGLDLERVENQLAKVPALRNDLFSHLGPSPYALLGLFRLGDRDAAAWSQDARVNSDDRPYLEFSAPRALYLDTGAANAMAVMAARGRLFPPVRNLDPAALNAPAVRLEIARSYLTIGRGVDEMDDLLRDVPGQPPMSGGHALQRLRYLLAVGAFEAVERELDRGIEEQRVDAEPAAVVRSAAQALKLEHWSGLSESQHIQGAARAAAIHDLLGQRYTHIGIKLREPALFRLAVEEYRSALELAPNVLSVLNNLANAQLELGRLEEAVTNYRRILSVQPNLPQVHFNLAMAHERLGQLDHAAAGYRRASQLAPNWPLPQQAITRLDGAGQK